MKWLPNTLEMLIYLFISPHPWLCGSTVRWRTNVYGEVLVGFSIEQKYALQMINAKMLFLYFPISLISFFKTRGLRSHERCTDFFVTLALTTLVIVAGTYWILRHMKEKNVFGSWSNFQQEKGITKIQINLGFKILMKWYFELNMSRFTPFSRLSAFWACSHIHIFT